MNSEYQESQAVGECACEHCGTRFQPISPEERFCCSGCEYVYRIIKDENLDRFYDLRGDVARPVSSSVFSRNDFSWLRPLIEKAEEGEERESSLILSLEGISCVGCVWLVDHLFKEMDGGLSCRVNVHYGTLEIDWESGRFDLVAFAERLKSFGYRVCPGKIKTSGETRQVIWRLGLSAAFAMNGMLYALPQYLGMEETFQFAPHFEWLSAFFATASMFVGGSYFIGRAIRAAAQGIAHLDLPISIGIIAAYLVSWYGLFTDHAELLYFDFVSTFIFLMLTGRWLQVWAVERNRNRLADIGVDIPVVQIETSGGGRAEASADQLGVGDRYWTKAGQRVPVRSDLVSARASVAMDWISGESESRILDTGYEVASGAEVESPFEICLEAREAWKDSLLCRLSERSTDSEDRDEVAQKWIARYLAIAATLALIGGLYWLIADSIGLGLMVFISVLVVSCPCALGIAWPFADEVALARLRGAGVFVTTHSLWNRLHGVHKVVFDKTGTLTRPHLSLLNGDLLDTLPAEHRKMLSHLVANSLHPVSRSIREALMAKGYFSRERLAFLVSEETGKGVGCSANGSVWRLGRAAWAQGKENTDSSVGGTYFMKGDELVACFEFGDKPLPDSEREVSLLKERGYELSILSGDSEAKALEVGRALGFEETRVHAGLLPEEKARWIRVHGSDDVMMVGDGANDTLAFAEARCCGAPANEQGIVAERADFHYLGNGIQGIRALLEVAGSRRLAVKALLSFAIVYNAAAVGFALAGSMTPLLAAILMPLSSVCSLAIVWMVVRK